jgi:glutaredoxin
MEHRRCSVHGTTIEEGVCARCGSDAARRNKRTVQLFVGAAVVVILFALAGRRSLQTMPSASADEVAPATSESSAARAPAPDREALITAAMRDVSVVLYTTSYCGWCRKTKSWLDGHGVSYVERHVDTDTAAANEMHRKFRDTGVPAVDIEGQLRQGYDPAWLERALRARAESRVGPG